jgi:hypothetical protein
MSMIVQVNLNAKEHPQIPRFSYNFQPPTASSQVPVDSIIIATPTHNSSSWLWFTRHLAVASHLREE